MFKEKLQYILRFILFVEVIYIYMVAYIYIYGSIKR